MAVNVILEAEFKPGMAGQVLEGFKAESGDQQNGKSIIR